MTCLSNPSTRDQIQSAADRCLDFLASLFDERGHSRIDPSSGGHHFKLPYVLNYGGRRALAMRVLAHVANDLIQPDGQYKDTAANDSKGRYLYEGGWLAWGSESLGRFDWARKFAKQLAVQQDPQWGGWFSDNEQGRVQRVLLCSGAMAGCAAAGELEAAAHGARYFERLLDRQPEPDRRFYYNLGEDGEVVTAPTDDPTMGCYDFHDHVRPAHFAPVIAGLTWLGEHTGNETHFNTARRFADVLLSNPNASASPFASKSGWAALMLHRHRPSDDLVEYAQAIGQALIKRQQDDGRIDITDAPGLEGGQSDAISIATTCDWTVTAIALVNGAA